MLIFEPDLPSGRWSSVTAEGVREPPAFDRASVEAWIEELLLDGPPAAFVYVLRHGGQIITAPFGRLSQDQYESIARCAPFWAEENNLTLSAAQTWQERVPGVPHLLACNTAYFAGLPGETSTYALPADLRSRGIRRYGSDGLCHAWAYAQAGQYSASLPRRVISVHLAVRSTSAALLDGNPLDVSAGLTPVEGLLSGTASGDIDPSVELILRGAGFSPEDITRAITRESGFAALLGRPCGMEEILQDPGPGAALAREMLRHGLLKQIGSCFAVLGGADLLVFANEAGPAGENFLADVVRGLAFLGVSYRAAADPSMQGGVQPAPEHASGPGVIVLPYRRDVVLAGMAAGFLNAQRS